MIGIGVDKNIISSLVAGTRGLLSAVPFAIVGKGHRQFRSTLSASRLGETQ